MKAEEARLLAAKKRHEDAFRRYLKETARYEERLEAYQKALAERTRLEEELAHRLEELQDLEERWPNGSGWKPALPTCAPRPREP